MQATRLPLAKNPGSAEAPELGEGEVPSEQVTNLYLWNGSGPANTFTLITKPKPENLAEVPVGEEGVYKVDGASTDCTQGIFESPYVFHGAPAGSLYKWSGQTIETASVLPDGKAAEGVTPVNSGETGSTVNLISSNGETVFFMAHADAGADIGKQAVFARTGTTTVEVSAPRGGTATLDTGARFQAASPNGKRVFFTANYGLAPTKSSGTEARPNAS